MTFYLFAAAWDDFFKFLPFIIALLVWVINQFAGKAKPPLPPQKRIPPAPGANPPRPAQGQAPGQPQLQTEIDDFLRQMQAQREVRKAQQQPSGFGKPPAKQPMTAGSGQERRPRSQQRPQETAARRETPPAAQQRPTLAPEKEPPRESVAQYVAEHIDSNQFAQRATALSHIQKESDSEFQQHMDRVFQPKTGLVAPRGIFELAGDVSAAATLATATATASGPESATAPVTIYKSAGNIALFLASRKNIRDAIILTEILQRPEHRWVTQELVDRD